MKSIRLLVSILILVALNAGAQESAPIHAVRLLEQQGQFARVIEVVEPLLESTILSDLDRGTGWMMLGSAYQYEERIQEATGAYEQSLRLLKKDRQHSRDYAEALGTFGTLYRDLGEFRAGTAMQLRALKVYEQTDDHAGIAVTCELLADLMLARTHNKDARVYLTRSGREAELASGLDDNYFASVSATDAWLAESVGNFAAAVYADRRALDLWKGAHGENHALVGWAYILLGRSYLKAGAVGSALHNMRRGLAILGQTVGTGRARYLIAEMAYAEALDSSGMHSEALQIRTDAKRELDTIRRTPCLGCRVSAAALQ
jgi:tetratricopeptide (TPR) repeat protein